MTSLYRSTDFAAPLLVGSGGVHPTASKLRVFLIVGMVSSLFHVRREVVLGSDSEAPNTSVSYDPRHPVPYPGPWLRRSLPEPTREVLTGLNLEQQHTQRCSRYLKPRSAAAV